MTFKELITSRNQQQFSQKMLNSELLRIQREQKHLSRKARERTLTDWESHRIIALALEQEEFSEVLKQIGSNNS